MKTTFLKTVAVVMVMSLVLISLTACGGNDDDQAVSFPEREIEFIVPWAPGGGSDIEMRIAAEHAQKYLDENFVIINLPGVGGTVGLEELKEKEPNGYHVGMVHEGLLVAHHSGITEINYDDFDPVASMSASDQYLAVATHLGVDTLEEFVAYANENTIRFGGTLAGIPRVWVEQIARALEIDYNMVGYEGLGEAITALAGGHIDAAVIDYAGGSEFVEAGNFKFIAIGTSERSEKAPDVETFVENGYDVTMSIHRGIVAPKGTPPEIIAILAEAFEQAAADPEYIEAIGNVGADISFMAADEYLEHFQRQDQIISEIIADIF